MYLTTALVKDPLLLVSWIVYNSSKVGLIFSQQHFVIVIAIQNSLTELASINIVPRVSVTTGRSANWLKSTLAVFSTSDY